MIYIPDSVFPLNEAGQKICPKCRHALEACDCPELVESRREKKLRIRPVVRIEKSGRQGKTVTVITALPPDEKYLKDLAKVLKSQIGSGGTFYIKEGVGVVEVQGKHADVCVRVIEQHM